MAELSGVGGAFINDLVSPKHELPMELDLKSAQMPTSSDNRSSSSDWLSIRRPLRTFPRSAKKHTAENQKSHHVDSNIAPWNGLAEVKPAADKTSRS